MFILTVKYSNGSQQQSDFATKEECEAHFEKTDWGEEAGYSHAIKEVKDKLETISPRQIRLALLALGITEDVIDGAISTLVSPEKEMAMIAWKYSNEYTRNVSIVNALGVILGINEQELDKLWKSAVKL